MREFYEKFQKDLSYAEKHMENLKAMEKPTDEKCERCGSPLVIKWGKHGSFFACSAYDKRNPESCTFTKENPINLTDLDTADGCRKPTKKSICENCGRTMVSEARALRPVHGVLRDIPTARRRGAWIRARKCPTFLWKRSARNAARNMLLRHGRYGEFMSCSGYPDCKYVKQNFIGMKCPDCKEGELVEKRARTWEFVLRMFELSEMQVHFGVQADSGEVSGVRHEYLVQKPFLKSGPVIACPNDKCEYLRPLPQRSTTSFLRGESEQKEEQFQEEEINKSNTRRCGARTEALRASTRVRVAPRAAVHDA